MPAASVEATRAACAEHADALRQRILDALPADRNDLLREFVRERVIRVLKLDPAHPPSAQ